MKIVDISGEHTATTIEDVEAILQRREEQGFNAFWLSHDGEEYPMLSVLVRGNDAVLDFLERGDEPGFRSLVPDVNPEGCTVFCISRNRADDLEIPNDSLVSFERAVTAAKEFFVSKKLPQCIEWLEL